MRDETKKMQHEAERTGQPMTGEGAMRESGAMPLESQDPEVAGHARTTTTQPTERDAMAEKELQPEGEGRMQQRTVSQQPEQPI